MSGCPRGRRKLRQTFGIHNWCQLQTFERPGKQHANMLLTCRQIIYLFAVVYIATLQSILSYCLHPELCTAKVNLRYILQQSWDVLESLNCGMKSFVVGKHLCTFYCAWKPRCVCGPHFHTLCGPASRGEEKKNLTLHKQNWRAYFLQSLWRADLLFPENDSTWSEREKMRPEK